jgi:hypothetical protein
MEPNGLGGEMFPNIGFWVAETTPYGQYHGPWSGLATPKNQTSNFFLFSTFLGVAGPPQKP